jgi:hypothetical protein
VPALNPGSVLLLKHAEREKQNMTTENLEKVKLLGLFLLKAMIDGRGDELIDLAKVNPLALLLCSWPIQSFFLGCRQFHAPETLFSLAHRPAKPSD